MRNIIDYVNQYGKMSFQKVPFGDVDSLIFSELAYLKYDIFFRGEAATNNALTLKELSHAPDMEELFKGLHDPIPNRALLFAVANSYRFGSTIVDYYSNLLDEEKEVQFSAVTFFPKGELPYLAFRGTDETLIGWKEDFNMAFISPVPSQEMGVAYLEQLVPKLYGDFRMGGHSKGGNIAVYTAIKADAVRQDRISAVYSHDGPGFQNELLEDQGYLAISNRIFKTIPQSSIVGLLLQHQETYKVIKSSKLGLLQHDPFSWIVQKGSFVYLDDVDANAMFMNQTLNQWLTDLGEEERKEFINLIFGLFSATEISTVNELTEEWRRVLSGLIEASKELDSETVQFLHQTLRQLMHMGTKNLSVIGRRKKTISKARGNK